MVGQHTLVGNVATVRRRLFLGSIWLAAAMTTACSLFALPRYSDSSNEVENLPVLPSSGEYYGDLNPAQPGEWVEVGGCRKTEGMRIWLSNRSFIYTMTTWCGGTESTDVQTWKTYASGTADNPYGTVTPKGMIWAQIGITSWTVGPPGTAENRQTQETFLVGQIAPDLTSVRYCFDSELSMGTGEAALNATLEACATDGDAHTLGLERVAD